MTCTSNCITSNLEHFDVCIALITALAPSVVIGFRPSCNKC